LPPEARETLNTVSEKIQACRQTLEQLRVVVKPRPIVKGAVNVNELITNGVEEKTKELQRDDVGVVLRLDAGLPAVLADAEQMRWMLATLIENSRRAMRETDGVRTLAIRTERRGQLARITVSDTRPCVPSDRLEDLFKLRQAGGERPEEANLSLLACRAIVERHGWQMATESLFEEGTALVIECPLPEDAAPRRQPEPKAAVLESPPEGPPADATVGNVLVISGEDVVIDFLEYYLRSQGHLVETSRDGREAKRRLQHGDYDLIFCDVEMPGLSGRKVFQWLQTNKPDVALRFIFITGDAPAPETLAFLGEQERRWLQKPFDLTELRQAIAEVLDQPRE